MTGAIGGKERGGKGGDCIGANFMCIMLIHIYILMFVKMRMRIMYMCNNVLLD